MTYVPMGISEEGRGERSYDLFSRLLKDRIIMVDEINSTTATIIISQLLFLDAEDSDKDITLYIKSPGGVVTEGLAIMDTMDLVKADVSTVCVGCAASMGAMILSHGTKGKRYILPRAEVMIHQPLGGAQGQATDIEIAAKRIVKMKKDLAEILAENCDQKLKKIEKDMDRDFWMTAEEAVEYGIVDKIIGGNK